MRTMAKGGGRRAGSVRPTPSAPRLSGLCRPLPAVLAVVIASASACSGTHSALNPAGPQAARIGSVWWLIFSVETAIFVIVLAFLAWAIWRRRAPDAPPAESPAEERRLGLSVATGVGISVVILFVFLVFSIRTGRAIASLGRPHAVTIGVVGHQWWWEIHYSDPVADQRVVTANEIHIPVGEPVVLELSSRDVIHSFWVPALHGKRDLIPGYEMSFWIEAQYPGVYDGQCAEYCGEQHAHMRIQVIAEPRSKFESWLTAQRQPAREPVTESERRGREVFLAAPCTQCHRIAGTKAWASVAPDLTHVGSRLMLAAGTIPNTTGHLAGWILDPQQLKPGNHMPPNALKSEDLQALVAYLRSLK